MARIISYALVLSFSLFIAYLTRQQVGHETYVGASWFLAGWFGLLLTAVLLTWYRPAKIKLHPVMIVLCFIPMFGTEPLFENDQYRYFWEGKVLAEGHNPWRSPPAAEILDGIKFPEHELVGFNKLTSPYSPLAVAYHAIFSRLEYSSALLALQLFNAFLCALVIFMLPPLKPVYAIGIAGLLGKEFVQSVHIDLVVWLFLWLAISQMNKASVKNSAFAFLVSALFKVNILLMYPWFFCAAYRAQGKRGLIIWLTVLVAAVGANVLGPLSFHEASGLIAFLQHWVWHSAVIGLWQNLGGDAETGIRFAGLVWVTGIAGMGLLCLKTQVEGWRWATILFSFNALWRPAFNAWYFPWFALSGVFAFQELAIWYGLVAPLSYLKYADPSNHWLLALTLVTHLPGVVYLASQVPRKRKFDRQN